jgi:hypothetical protein
MSIRILEDEDGIRGLEKTASHRGRSRSPSPRRRKSPRKSGSPSPRSRRSRSPSPAASTGRSSRRSLHSHRTGRSPARLSPRRPTHYYKSPSPPLSPPPAWQKEKWKAKKKRAAFCGLGALLAKKPKSSLVAGTKLKKIKVKSLSPRSSSSQQSSPSHKKKSLLGACFGKKSKVKLEKLKDKAKDKANEKVTDLAKAKEKAKEKEKEKEKLKLNQKHKSPSTSPEHKIKKKSFFAKLFEKKVKTPKIIKK